MPDLRRAWSDLSTPLQHAICVSFLLACALAFYAPIVFTGQTLVGSDTVKWQANAESVIAFEDEAGRPALWAPNTYGGMPAYFIHYPARIPQLDGIPTMLRKVVWPVSHLLFLLVGTYWLVFVLARDKLAGTLSAVAFGFTTYVPLLLVAGHNTKFVALCFAPWMALAFVYCLRRPRLLSALLFAIALALNLRARHIQITYCLTFLLLCWWLVEGVQAYRRRRIKAFGASTAFLALGSLLGLLMVAQPYLAQLELSSFTIRGGGMGWQDSMDWSQGPGELLTFLIADAFGGGGSMYWGPKTFTIGPHYVGGVVVLLAVLALFRSRRTTVAALGIGAFGMILLSLGSHLPALNRLVHAYLPFYDRFRAPETWLSLVAFALAILAGTGLRFVLRAKEKSCSRAILFTTSGLCAVVLVLLMFGNAVFDFRQPDEPENVREQVTASTPDADAIRVMGTVQRIMNERVARRQAAFRDDALRTFLFLLLANGVIFAYFRGRLPGWGMQWALIALVLVDLWSVDRRFLNEEHLADSRTARQVRAYDVDDYINKDSSGVYRVLSLESGDPMLHARPSYFHQSLGGYQGARLQRYQDFIDRLFVDLRTGLPDEDMLDMLNVRYVIARSPMPNMEQVFQSDESELVVLKNPDVLPRGHFVGRTRVIKSDEEVWSYLQNDEFDPHDIVVLSEPVETNALDSTSVVQAEMRQYTPEEIRWDVRSDAPRLFVTSEIFYPAGWRAYVDGEQVPIYRANYLLRTVRIPKGRHTLVMRFEPRSHYVGVWISGISTLLVYGASLFMIVLEWRRRS